MASVVGVAGVTTDDQTNAAARRAAGEFVRGVSTARSMIGEVPEFPVESGRYHLYVAYNCPWCHRVVMVRAILGLEEVVTMDVLFPGRTLASDERGENLWRFAPDGVETMNGRWVSFPECTIDTVGGEKYIVDIYKTAGIEDQKSVPLLFDKKQKLVVNNESAEIMRMFTTALLPLARNPGELNLYPTADVAMIAKVDETNAWVYTDINNGAYKAGFSSNQDVYEAAYEVYFAAIAKLEQMLAQHEFILGPSVMETDVRAFATLWRHDPIYHNRMKLNKAFLHAYPHVWAWMGRMMQLPGMGDAAGPAILAHAKQGYFGRTGNGTVPLGPHGYPEVYGQKLQ